MSGGTAKWAFAGRTALITGAASGIGLATAHAFLKAGAVVILLDRDAEALERVVRESVAEHPGRALALVSDVTQAEEIDTQLDLLLGDRAPVHHLVNNAADFLAAGRTATRDQWSRVLDVNVTASARLTATIADRMTPGSTVVNVSSISAHVAQPQRWTYNATKAAVLALTRGEALDLAADQIRVNAVSPGWIRTPEVIRAAGAEQARWERVWGDFHILGRLGAADEVADAILFLSSDQSSFITGAELAVDGGYTAIGPEGLGRSSQFASAADSTS